MLMFWLSFCSGAPTSGVRGLFVLLSDGYCSHESKLEGGAIKGEALLAALRLCLIEPPPFIPSPSVQTRRSNSYSTQTTKRATHVPRLSNSRCLMDDPLDTFVLCTSWPQ
jgi:hypothetical protein